MPPRTRPPGHPTERRRRPRHRHSGKRRSLASDAVFLSIGNAPTAPSGDIVRETTGYYLPSAQHPRVIVAGDLRSARFQRIMTTLGSGSEAALHAYYVAKKLLDRDAN